MADHDREVLEAGIGFGYQLQQILGDMGREAIVRAGTDGTVIDVEVTLLPPTEQMLAVHPDWTFFARSNKNAGDGRWIGAGGQGDGIEAALDLIRQGLEQHITNPCRIVAVHDRRAE